jgi:hypothetical protein
LKYTVVLHIGQPVKIVVAEPDRVIVAEQQHKAKDGDLCYSPGCDVMSSIKTRLVKLESAMIPETEPLRIAHFIVDPGELDPIGYRCGELEIIRNHGESTEALRKRCSDGVVWLDGTCHRIFYPLIEWQ